jgi:hypothetical protein
MAQPRQDPTFDDQNRTLDLAFVARIAAARWQNRRVVMFGHSRKGWVERRFKP